MVWGWPPLPSHMSVPIHPIPTQNSLSLYLEITNNLVRNYNHALKKVENEHFLKFISILSLLGNQKFDRFKGQVIQAALVIRGTD